MVSKANSPNEQSGALSKIPLGIQPIRAIPGPDLASKLPLEILFQIFELYRTQETLKHPVETLLLVCKSWLRAALECPRLWSTFTISLEAFEFWSSHVSSRLKHSSQNDLLDIYIDAKGRQRGTRDSHQEAIFQKYHEAILLPLIGPNGEIARRWRRFVVTDEYRGRPYEKTKQSKLAKFLIFPTPELQELRIRNIVSSLPLFPLAPALKVFSAYDVQLSPLPDLSSAFEVDVIMTSGFQAAVAGALRVTTLQVNIGAASSYYLSTGYRHLTTLHLGQGLRQDGLTDFSAPALRELYLDFARGSEFLAVVACKGMPLHQLQKISIVRWTIVVGQGVESYREGLSKFLRAAKNIQMMVLRGRIPMALVLKLLTSECESLYQDRSVLLRVGAGVHESELRRGEERIPGINQLRDHIGGRLIPNGTWAEIIEALTRNPHIP